MTRFQKIRKALISAAATYKIGDCVEKPEVLRDCETADPCASLADVMEAIHYGKPASPFARFFDKMFDHDAVEQFVDGFADAAPEDYRSLTDCDTEYPWCMPWIWNQHDIEILTAKPDDTPYTLGERAAKILYSDMEATYRDLRKVGVQEKYQEIVEDYEKYRQYIEVCGSVDDYPYISAYSEIFAAIDEAGGLDSPKADKIITARATEQYEETL